MGRKSLHWKTFRDPLCVSHPTSPNDRFVTLYKINTVLSVNLSTLVLVLIKSGLVSTC